MPVPPIARRVAAYQLLPAVVITALTGWAAIDSAALTIRLIRNR